MLNAQNFVVASVKNPKCFGDCDGTITFTTGAVVGPFTAVLSNTSSCPNSTVQVSSANSITLSGICGCASDYTFSIYNPSMALVGTMVQQFINYATGPLAVNVNTLTLATCSNCCDGDITFTVTGGNLVSAPTYSIDGALTASVNPLQFLCTGNHTVCVQDVSGCIACKAFLMPYVGGPTGLIENSLSTEFGLYPNPANNELYLETNGKNISSVEIYDISGRKIASPDISKNLYSKSYINVEALMGGLYYVVIYQNGQIAPIRAKFVKKAE